MPNPRSLRFGFAFGFLVFAVAWVCLAWPPSQELEPTSGGPQSTEAGAAIAAERPRTSAHDAQREELTVQKPTEDVARFKPVPEVARVRIVDARTLAPLAGVDVYATSQWGGDGSRVTTDKNGVFRLNSSLFAGAWHLNLVDPDSEFLSLLPDRLWLEPDSITEVRLMRPIAELQLEVRGPTGLPVAGATINLARSAEGQARSYRRLWSDEQGLLTLPWPPIGESTSGWRATAFHAEEGSCAPVDLPDAAEPPRTVLQLQAGSRLELQVSNSVHTPYPFLQVRLRSHALTRQAFVAQVSGSLDHLDQNGSHVWTQLPPGEYNLSLRSPVGIGWLERSITLGAETKRVDWIIETPEQAVALEGRLFEDTLDLFPAVHQFVEIRDGVTDELIAGTRTDASGRFRLFGEATGEVVLYTALLDSSVAFPPHVFRFPAGKRDVVLHGKAQIIHEVVLRVTDRATGAPIPNARLLRSDSDFGVLAGSSDAQGLLVAAVIQEHLYVLQAEGFEPRKISGRQARQVFSVELDLASGD